MPLKRRTKIARRYVLDLLDLSPQILKRLAYRVRADGSIVWQSFGFLQTGHYLDQSAMRYARQRQAPHFPATFIRHRPGRDSWQPPGLQCSMRLCIRHRPGRKTADSQRGCNVQSNVLP